MREILFRGQTRRYGEKVYIPSGEKVPSNWAYGGIFPSHNGSMAIIYQQEPTIEKFPVHADTVGQYTGLKDRNGVKIFEGDIVKFRKWSKGSMCWIGKVHYENQQFVVSGNPNRECSTPFTLCMSRFVSEDIEVIGNVFDTPELLQA